MVVKRAYTSALRDEQSAATRRRILDAADEVFERSGYGGTTLAAIAGAAGVSVQTIYNLVGGKAAVLKAVYDVSLAGDDAPVPNVDRPESRAVVEAPDGPAALAAYAAKARSISVRVLPLVVRILAEAGSGNRDLEEFAATIEAERLVGCTLTATHIAEQFGLREGLSVDEAIDVLWSLTSADLADRLVNRRGWTWDRFETWLAQTMTEALLPPARRVRGARGARGRSSA